MINIECRGIGNVNRGIASKEAGLEEIRRIAIFYNFRERYVGLRTSRNNYDTCVIFVYRELLVIQGGMVVASEHIWTHNHPFLIHYQSNVVDSFEGIVTGIGAEVGVICRVLQSNRCGTNATEGEDEHRNK